MKHSTAQFTTIWKPVLYLLALAALATAAPGTAQMANEDSLIEEQRAAMEAFKWMDGTWQGTVSTNTPDGEIDLIQTERVGTIAGGTARLVEGRGYTEDGELAFNAIGMITFDAIKDEYVFTANARGRVTRAWFKVTETGFEWGFTAGPGTISYVTDYKDGMWIEDGFLEFGGQPKTKFLEMRLKRTGPSDWPNAGAIVPQ